MLARLSRLLIVLGLGAWCWVLFVIGVVWPGAGVVVLLVLLVRFAKRKRGVLNAFGTGRFADARELAQHIAARQGLILGRLIGSKQTVGMGVRALLFWPGRQAAEACRTFFDSLRGNMAGLVARITPLHLMCIAPTGAGKNVSVATPWLRSSPESQVVVDVKDGELCLLNAEYRRKRFRQPYFVFDPMEVLKGTGIQTHRFNPMDLVPRTHHSAVEICRMFGEAIVTTNERDRSDPHWPESARITSAFGLSYCAHEAPDKERHFASARRIIENPDLIARAIAHARKSDGYDGLLASMGNQMSHYLQNPKEMGSVMTTTLRYWAPLMTVPVMEQMSCSDCDVSLLRQGRGASIYFVLSSSCTQALRSALLRAWLSTLTYQLMGPWRDASRPVYIVGDEMSSVGYLPIFESACDRGRSAGVHLQMYFQNQQQVQVCFPESYETVMGNCSQMWFGVNTYDSAEKLSLRLGDMTQIVNSGGSGGSKTYTANSFGNSQAQGPQLGNSWNDGWQLQARRVLTAQEILSLDPRICITCHPGVPYPIISRLIRYYERDGKKLLGGGILRRFAASIGLLCKAILFLLGSTLVAYYVTVAGLAYENKQPVQPVFQQWR